MKENSHLDGEKQSLVSQAKRLKEEMYHHIRFNLGLDPQGMNRYAMLYGTCLCS